VRLSVVIPCLDESATVGRVVEEVSAALETLDGHSEIVVVDDGSEDDSAERARAAGARVVPSGGRRTGYGRAMILGAQAAEGDVIVFLDADGEHDPASVPRLLEAAEASHGLVLGSRALGGFEAGARSWLNRLVGTPVLTFLLNHYLGTRITDCNSGFRAIPKAAFEQLGTLTPGFEIASDMIARAALAGVPITEVPARQRPPPPGRQPHLRRWRDGWRHLKTIVLHAPDRVLLRPGLLTLLLGILLFVPQILGPVQLGPLRMDIHLMILGALLLFVGVEMVGAAVVCATLAGGGRAGAGQRSRGLGPRFVLDSVLPWAGLLFAIGFAADLAVVIKSGLNGWRGIMEPRLALAGTTGIGIAVQLVVLSFLHTVVGQRQGER